MSRARSSACSGWLLVDETRRGDRTVRRFSVFDYVGNAGRGSQRDMLAQLSRQSVDVARCDLGVRQKYSRSRARLVARMFALCSKRSHNPSPGTDVHHLQVYSSNPFKSEPIRTAAFTPAWLRRDPETQALGWVVARSHPCRTRGASCQRRSADRRGTGNGLRPRSSPQSRGNRPQ